MVRPDDPYRGSVPDEPSAPYAPPSYGRPPQPAPQPPSVPPGWGPPAGAAAGWAPYPGATPETSSRAVVALVCAVGSFVVLPFVPAVVAVFLARSARQEIAASGGRLTGEGLSRAAEVVAWVNIALTVLVVLALVALVAVAVSGSSA